MTGLVRALAALCSVGLIVGGLTGGEGLSDARWLGVLGTAWVLLLFAAWVRLPARVPTARRTTIRTGIVVASVFAVLSVQLVRIQVVHQAYTVDRVATAPDGEIIANPRTQGIGLDKERGRILDRNGEVLAYSEEDDGGYRRVYPEPAVAPIVGYYSPLQYGTAGLEAAYDQELSGEATTGAWGWFQRELLGRPQTGGGLVLTLDVELQQAAAGLLGDFPGAAVVIDVQTGAVLVLASAPAIDPNQLFAIDQGETGDAAAYWSSLTDDPGRPLIPRATLGLYAPGSTFKTITAAAAIDSEVAEPETVYIDDGDLEIVGRVLVENNRPDPTIDEWTLREGLAWSLNVVYAQVGLQLGAERLREYGERFGFDAEIPFSLPVNESQLEGQEDFLDDPNGLADTAFGQGELLVSPIHLALVAAGFANDGRMMEPYVVAEVRDASGEIVRQATPETWRRPISGESAAQVREMMVNAVEMGLIQEAQIPGLVVGGKTGTAELSGELPHSWFIGFAGDPEPRYAVAVMLENGGPGLGRALAIGRELLDLAMTDPLSGGETRTAIDTSAVGGQESAYVRAISTASGLSFSAKNGRIQHARFGGTTRRTAPAAAVRATCRRCAGRAAGRDSGDARQRRCRRCGLANSSTAPRQR